MSYFLFNSTNTFCISLLSNTKRLQKMQERFGKLQMEVTIWPACTKENLTNEFVYYLNDNARGCAQSHYNIWKHMMHNNIEYALILEDDACFDKHFFEKLEAFSIDIHDQKWDALFLNASEKIDITNKWVLDKEQYLTGGYILSKRGCYKLLSMFFGWLYAADWMTTRLQLYNHSYSYFPWLIIQEGEESTIGSNAVEDYKKVIRLLSEINYSLDNYII